MLSKASFLCTHKPSFKHRSCLGHDSLWKARSSRSNKEETCRPRVSKVHLAARTPSGQSASTGCSWCCCCSSAVTCAIAACSNGGSMPSPPFGASKTQVGSVPPPLDPISVSLSLSLLVSPCLAFSLIAVVPSFCARTGHTLPIRFALSACFSQLRSRLSSALANLTTGNIRQLCPKYYNTQGKNVTNGTFSNHNLRGVLFGPKLGESGLENT